MLKRSKHIILICGIAALVTTVIFYQLTFDSIFSVPMVWISLMFLILTEIIGIIKAIIIKKTIFGISNILTSFGHLIIVLIVSIFFVNTSPLLIKTYILLNILFVCILLVTDAIIIFFAKRIAMQNDKLRKSQVIVGGCLKKATSLCIEFNNTVYKKDLDEIVELLKYSDNSCLSDDELTIMNKLDEVKILLKNNEDGVGNKINEVKNVIKLRSVKVASMKLGDY